MNNIDLVIIGGGPAGLSCAYFLAVQPWLPARPV